MLRERKLLLIFKEEEKMVGYHTRWSENEDFSFFSPVLRQKLPCLNVRALITREIMRSKDVQGNTKNNLQNQYFLVV